MQALLPFGQVAKEPAYLFDYTPHIPTKILLAADIIQRLSVCMHSGNTQPCKCWNLSG